MEPSIRANDTTFGDFYNRASRSYYIPSLQRPYTWDKREVEKLVEDILENDDGYYIGSIVAVVSGGTLSRDQIIDGQQRMTTLSLFVIALRNYIRNRKSKTFSDIERELDKLLIEYSRDNKDIRLCFDDEHSNSIYQSLVLEEDKEPKSVIQKRFVKNLRVISEMLKEHSPKCKYNEINDIYNKLKSLQIIFIKCSNRSSAYNLFESINATGISLATTDLIKNSLFESLKDDHKAFKFVENGWKKMFELFNEDSSFLKTYIRHHWISSVGYISHSKLFDAFTKKYEDEEIKYAKSLFDLAGTYLSLRNAQVESLELTRVRYELSEIKETLTFLGFLGVEQIYSVLLFIYEKNNEQFKKDLNRLAAFQFIYKYSSSSPSIPERKYFAAYCENEISRQEFFSGLKKLCLEQKESFVSRLLERIKFVEGKSGEVQFILEKLIYVKGGGGKFMEPTIEHIIPQDKSDKIHTKFVDGDEALRLIHSLGNLTILEKSENSDKTKFNQELSAKFPLYKDNTYCFNKEINSYPFESDPRDAIKLRGKKIAMEIYDIFLKTIETGKWK